MITRFTAARLPVLSHLARWDGAIQLAIQMHSTIAVSVLKERHVASGERSLSWGGAGSVGVIATRLVLTQGLIVTRAAGPRDQEFVHELGALPVRDGPTMPPPQ
jgi:NADPH:quinone reductase-like Zn-dependent oxidoreductase